MKDEKKNSWEEVITSTDLTHNSRWAWQTIRKLSNDPTAPNPPCLVNANQVAHQLLINNQGSIPTKPKQPILLPIHEGTLTMVHHFSEEEYRNVQMPIHGYIHCSTYASQETRSPRYGDSPRLSRYPSQGKTPRLRRTTDQSPSYAIRTIYANK